MYRTIDARFWTDPKVKQLSPENKLLFLYFITSPHAHFSGLYYVPTSTISHETGLKTADVLKGIDTLSIGYLVRIDTISNLIWVVNMFRYQSHSRKLLKNIGTHLEGLHKSPLIGQFLERYSELDIPYRYPIDTVYDKEQEQDQRKEQDQDQETSVDFAETDSIIDYLNTKSKAAYRHSKASRENIHARLAEKFSFDDCKLMIDFKVADWLGNPEMEKYLTPETLFRPTKFENNVNAAKRWDAGGRKSTNGTPNRSLTRDPKEFAGLFEEDEDEISETDC